MNDKSISPNNSLVQSARLDLARVSTAARRGLVLADELTTRQWRGRIISDSTVAKCLAISPNRHYELLGGLIGGGFCLFLLYLEDGKPFRTLAEPPKGNAGTFEAVGFTDDSHLGLSVNKDNKSVQIWDLENGKEIRHFELYSGFNQGGRAIFSPNGKYVLSSASVDGSLFACAWEVMTGRLVSNIKTEGFEWCTAFSRDGSLFLVGGFPSIKLYKTDSGEQINQFDPISEEMNVGDLPLACAFSPDDSRIVAGNQDGSIRLWDAHSGRETFHLEGHSGSILNVAFSPNGLLVASGGYDKTVRIWDVKNRKQLCRCDGHTDKIILLEFELDFLLASSSFDRTLRSWSPSE